MSISKHFPKLRYNLEPKLKNPNFYTSTGILTSYGPPDLRCKIHISHNYYQVSILICDVSHKRTKIYIPTKTTL